MLRASCSLMPESLSKGSIIYDMLPMKGILSMKIFSLVLFATAALAQQQAAPQPLVQVRGNEGAGSTIFGNACGGCHGKLEGAPPPAMLKKLTPEKIYEALTTGDMRNQ